MKSNLSDLTKKYVKFYNENNFNLSPKQWQPVASPSILSKQFRGETDYVWQTRLGDGKEEYIQYYKQLKKIDKLNLFLKTKENGSHGCKTWEVENILISRDLLDSIIEIYFLQKNFDNLDKLNILEIGGGYGRLCKRYSDCFPNSKFYITDGIPYSTYVADIYLSESNYQNKNLELYNLDSKLKNIKIDLAVNIHSFPEQNINDVEWWVKFILKHKIKYIFYVDNFIHNSHSNINANILKIFNKYNYDIICDLNMFKELDINFSYNHHFFIFENSFI